jgi:glycosyltransferase involved in cell wall biosynthesis
MPAYSFVVPIYYDGYLARPFCEEIEKEMRLFLEMEDISREIEVIFVNDGSRDDSQRLLREVAQSFPFVKVIELSRNFGQHVAVSCGYRFASGDYVAMMNADMQDPPDQIGALVEKLRRGDCDIVLGLRQARQGTWHEELTSRAFNALLNALTGAKTPTNVASLRMMTRPFVDAYNTLNEKSPYIPGLENWLGFRHGYVLIRHQRRAMGKSSYTFRRRLHMATESIVSFSDLPLRLAAVLGFIVSGLGVLLVGRLLVMRWLFSEILPGYTSTMSVIVLLGGANLTFLGLLGLYVGRILREVQNRPRYVVESVENITGEAPANESRQIRNI